MIKIEISVVIYEDDKGNSEVADYIKSLPSHKLDKLMFALTRLETEGTFVGAPLVKSLIVPKKTGFSMWELRIDRDRYPFIIHNQEIVIVTHFLKQTQATPEREIKKAIKIAKKWKERN